MVDAKLVRVRDRGTDMVFMVATVTGRFAGALSTFHHPPYDIKERSAKLDVNSTTIGVTNAIRHMSYVDIPNVIDLRENI